MHGYHIIAMHGLHPEIVIEEVSETGKLGQLGRYVRGALQSCRYGDKI